MGQRKLSRHVGPGGKLVLPSLGDHQVRSAFESGTRAFTLPQIWSTRMCCDGRCNSTMPLIIRRCSVIRQGPSCPCSRDLAEIVDQLCDVQLAAATLYPHWDDLASSNQKRPLSLLVMTFP